MRMKKSISAILSGVLLAAALLGCASGKDTVDPGNAANAQDGEGSEKVYVPVLPTGMEDASIFVEKIDDLPEDFVMGMDISSLPAEEESGVKYYDENGKEEDLLKILADSGINCVRVRVWVDPFDKDGNGYGGGNCTSDTAAVIGKRAAAYGMSTCVDFHYSDFWADPKKQMTPKAWEGMSTDEKAAALSEYTKESLKKIIDSGADVTMVQIGNEINNGMSGEKGLNNKLKLVKAGCNAVREISDERGTGIKTVLHYTQVDDAKNILEIARQLDAAKIDYDVFGISYYPYWHGSYENMEEVLREITDTYGVETCIMETAYPYTDKDGDGTGNSVSATSLVNTYPLSVQGQANAVRDIMDASVKAGAIGVFYWEGAWIPVGSDYTSNTKIWEKCGSGWASSFASGYDPDDAGKYYGGSSWDNQAMFDNAGKKLPSLDVFKYARYGAVGEKAEILTDLSDPGLITVDVSIGGDIIMPEDLPVTYNDSSIDSPLKINWDKEGLSGIDTSYPGTYTIKGTAVSDALPGEEVGVISTVNVSNINYIVNPGFEDEIKSEWDLESYGGGTSADIQDKEADAHGGTKAFHFYNAKEYSCEAQQTLSGIPAGIYSFSAYAQGKDMGEDSVVILFVEAGDERYESENTVLDGWQNWKEIKIDDIMVNDGDEVTVGCMIQSGKGGWGTVDDMVFSLSGTEDN